MTRPTPTIEDYLTILYVLERDGVKAIPARLAEALEVSAPTVTVTLKRMERDGWTNYEGRKGIQLTEEGREAARSVMRRHMLLEWMLHSVLKVPWSRIHLKAHQIEHTISEEIEARMRDNLREPQVCPHGNPLPGYEHVVAGWVPLTQTTQGQAAILRRVHELAEDRNDLLAFMEANGMLPGVEVEVGEVLPAVQTLTLRIGERQVTLGLPIARYIYVETLRRS
jgi:DtxR family Mn-dependent transcriptional regulator